MRRPRLVIADDNPRIMKAVSTLLEDSFEIVGNAMDGEAALNAVLDLNPDVLVADLSMPVMTGLELAACLRQLNHRVRVVLLTVQEDLGCARSIEAAGLHGYVFKRRAAIDLIPAIELALSGGRFASHAPDNEYCRIAEA